MNMFIRVSKNTVLMKFIANPLRNRSCMNQVMILFESRVQDMPRQVKEAVHGWTKDKE